MKVGPRCRNARTALSSTLPKRNLKLPTQQVKPPQCRASRCLCLCSEYFRFSLSFLAIEKTGRTSDRAVAFHCPLYSAAQAGFNGSVDRLNCLLSGGFSISWCRIELLADRSRWDEYGRSRGFVVACVSVQKCVT